ncbi:uncharacterized protein LOC127856882 isoform X1 [Dreissena polymorpha]|uniref:uncharacterized protein LOC127856882 isoform X1 n=1 Tax=Dreissena polymorpha TaxID=45954 RepID=UPI002264AB54|nr:uncharacterized protein LOC127856882 isoform X1 [Dreissena polymorpha]XP_052249021.1 uncharacterized protein LOC127856882 isoform X1 [Dreissena polymorpha]
MTTKNERTLTFNPATTIQQTLSTLSGLGQIIDKVKPAKRKTQNTVTRKSTLTASSKSDPKSQITPGFKVQQSIPEYSSSPQYSTGNQTSDVTKSGQVSDPVSSSSHTLVQGYQPGTVSESDTIIKMERSKKYNVKIPLEWRNSVKCSVSSICETANGELLITDYFNNRVKLLNQTYKVVAYCDLPGRPFSICSIDSSLVAVTLRNREVHFIRVTNDQLVKDKILKLKHYCYGIAHHKGNLYITDSGALYCYTVDGRLVSEMYEETSGGITVKTCAVSPDGERIYVAKWISNQLVTLSRDGTVISTFTDPALDWGDLGVLSVLHVTDSGQVLVCGIGSHKIIQVDRDGRQRLAEVVTKKDGVHNPTSVYYRKHTGSLIVGMYNNYDLLVFEAQ